ncbi:MAG: alpha/beta fold hydrolase [Acidimicrobiales bacterium]
MLTSYLEGRLFGSRTGTSAPWVLALHGWRRTHADFGAVLGAGEATLDSIALDLPGFGATPPPPAPWGSAEYATELLPVLVDMAAERGGPVVVLGHSFGGRVAAHLAAGSPELVRALVLSGVPRLAGVGTAGVGTKVRRTAPTFRIGRALHRRGLIGEATMEGLRMRYGSADYRGAQGVMRQVLVRAVNESYEAQLAALRCDVELVWGEADTVAPLDGARQAAEALGARGRLSVCPGVGHLTPLEAPGALREALERHRPAPKP